ncbi:adenosylcobinamide-phosphate synthase CbiB [Mesobacillus selenatarsenatis]|uniref:Cobalamin biosynthesis protein CobD n=1 Tax=Mesobacillus selenatarsenatis (strain DSM 18680 / JCM 14380 / FERM P-15431 / SF-1) TaxID=1321606 RepID=A0A0A8WX13_MESS1|nr:adenosylcobinamide-phosphate synthase CbiB [Mesobacillus selenatarsenatis]GAM12200.1 adenosylcobinamide-phosphate synthase [Mesobacillus selenatarsenatis SF-1]
MILNHLIALTIAVIIDLIIGDPPDWPHPVKWMGSLINRLDQRLNVGPNRKSKGVAMTAVVLLIAGSAALLVTSVFYLLHPVAGIMVEAILISTTIAQKSLKEAALSVYYPLVNEDLEEARHKLSWIVGRDTELLEEPELVRAAVETVAENTSDGITAPLFWALLGGAPLAIIYRAINTCDSMVGYKNEKYLEFGWASARLDDAANWIPSRITSICILLSKRPLFMTRTDAWKLVRRDAKKHPSPNSGWGEAAVAAILGVQLGGVNYYKGIISKRATMGDALIKLEKNHILVANKIVTATVPLFIILLWLGGSLYEMAISWFQSSLFI